MAYGIAIKCANGEMEYFCGFTDGSLPIFGEKKDAVTYSCKLHAETQAMLLAQDDNDVVREAVHNIEKTGENT